MGQHTRLRIDSGAASPLRFREFPEMNGMRALGARRGPVRPDLADGLAAMLRLFSRPAPEDGRNGARVDSCYMAALPDIFLDPALFRIEHCFLEWPDAPMGLKWSEVAALPDSFFAERLGWRDRARGARILRGARQVPGNVALHRAARLLLGAGWGRDLDILLDPRTRQHRLRAGKTLIFSESRSIGEILRLIFEHPPAHGAALARPLGHNAVELRRVFLPDREAMLQACIGLPGLENPEIRQRVPLLGHLARPPVLSPGPRRTRQATHRAP